MALPAGSELPVAFGGFEVEDISAIPEIALERSGGLADTDAFCRGLAAVAQDVFRAHGLCGSEDGKKGECQKQTADAGLGQVVHRCVIGNCSSADIAWEEICWNREQLD